MPLVLFLFTAAAARAVALAGLGVALMLTHRLYARPFALSRAQQALPLVRRAGRGRARGRPRRAARAHVLAGLRRGARWLSSPGRWGGRGTARSCFASGSSARSRLFSACPSAAALGRPAWLAAADAVAVFRLGVALTVLPFGWLGPLAGPPGGPNGRLPFPVHIQALLGTVWVLWLFRLVGLWWLVAALLHLARRVA